MKKWIFLSLFFLTGCASIVGSTSETVSILSNIDDADITIKNKDYIPIMKVKSPTIISLDKSAGFFQGERYTIRAEKKGFKPQEQELNTGLSGWYLGNIIFGGLIGMLIVDPATGAMWTFNRNKLFFNLDRLDREN